MITLPDKWVWDFWFAQDGPDYHIFYMQAPRSLGREDLRHWHVSFGHAVSQNLHTWDILPDALHPSHTEAWDDYTTWTGSIIRHAGVWHMLYTGGKRSEKGLVQRIGLATSPDLMQWEKHPENPLIVADSRWYELLDLTLWHDHAWRDPYVFQHPATGEFHALITARCNNGPADGRGVIAHARSTDLRHWEVLPPLTEPGDFGHLEVPQVVAIGDHYYLLFSAQDFCCSARYRQRTGLPAHYGIYYFRAESLLGPFDCAAPKILVGDPIGAFYSGKLIQDPQHTWQFLACRNFNANREFIGEISDPIPLEITGNGELTLPEIDPGGRVP